jgi:hypothetical protein
MTDYLKKYGKSVTKHQTGGPVAEAAPAQGAPAEEGAAQGSDLQSMLMEAYQSQDPAMALQVVNAIVEQMQAGQGGQEQSMPAARKGMLVKKPIFKKGGVLKA